MGIEKRIDRNSAPEGEVFKVESGFEAEASDEMSGHVHDLLRIEFRLVPDWFRIFA